MNYTQVEENLYKLVAFLPVTMKELSTGINFNTVFKQSLLCLWSEPATSSSALYYWNTVPPLAL